MLKITLSFILSISLFICFGQKPITDAVQNRAVSVASLIGDIDDQVQLGLLVNDLVFDVTQVAQKVQVCETQLKVLEAMVNHPEAYRYMSASYRLSLIERVQFTSINIKIYGKAVGSLLKAIQRNMREHEAALVKRQAVDNVAKDTQQAIAEQVMLTAMAALRDNPYTRAAGLGQSADMTPVNQKLEEGKQKMDAVARLRKSHETIEGYIDEVNDLNDMLDKYLNDINLLTLGVRGAVGLNVVMVLGAGTQAVNTRTVK